MFISKMKKSVILFILPIILLLSGCNESGNYIKRGKTELSFFTYGSLSDPSYIVENEIYEDFKLKNTDIDIKIERMFGDPFSYKLEAYALTNRVPDIVFMWPGGKSSILHKRKLMKDLYPFIENEKEKFLSPALEPQLSGYLAELPSGITITHTIYVNEEILRKLNLKVPKNYDELKTVSKKLRLNGYQTILMANKETWVLQSCLFSTIVGRVAGDDFIDKIIKNETKFTDAPFIKSLNFLKQLFKDDVISTKTFEIGYNESPALFVKGNWAFYIDGDWRTSAFVTGENNESQISIENQRNISLMMFPEIPDEINHNTVSGVVSIGYGISNTIKKGSDKEKAAWRFISYLQSEDVQKKRLEKVGTFPSRKGIQVDNLEPIVSSRGDYYSKPEKITYVLDSVFDTKVATQINLSLQELSLGVKSTEEIANDINKVYEESLK